VGDLRDLKLVGLELDTLVIVEFLLFWMESRYKGQKQWR